MVMLHVFGNSSAQRCLPDEDHPIQAFVFDRAYETLSIRIQIRRHRWQPDDLGSTIPNQPAKLLRILGIAINDQMEAIIPSLVPRDAAADDFRRDVEKAVRYANITIIEGTGASQFGIGVVAARIVEIIARDERAVVPIGAYSNEYGVTLTLPARLGRDGISAIIMPTLSSEEDHRLGQSASVLRQALKTINA